MDKPLIICCYVALDALSITKRISSFKPTELDSKHITNSYLMLINFLII